MKKLLFLVMLFTMLFSVNAYAAVDTNALNNNMLSSINQLRASLGEQALTIDSSLISIANIRSQEASSKWSHTRPNGTQGADMIPADKWRGENLSYITGTENAAEASKIMFDDLVASPTHYDNMVFDKFTKIGISSYVENGKITVAYMFSS
ncbi:MAG: CAP domain-containing protein [Lachnospiraceae bacterium]|nr:CAP domain-containing protein [Lachnospiraceae bacterium]